MNGLQLWILNSSFLNSLKNMRTSQTVIIFLDDKLTKREHPEIPWRMIGNTGYEAECGESARVRNTMAPKIEKGESKNINRSEPLNREVLFS